MKVALVGRGKMGRAVGQLAAERGWEVTCLCGSDRPLDQSNIERADVVIEFTHPDAAVGNIEQLLSWRKDLVVGTTGWIDQLEHVKQLVDAAGCGFLYGPNFSVGMNLLYRLCEEAGALFARYEFAPFIFETHHQAKKDAPSGTAHEMEARVRGAGIKKEIAVSSLRAGSFPGTHILGFDGRFETITLKHEVRDRRVFAEGALLAAEWIRGKKGVYTFSDILGGR
ncbi:MAG TPA: 4-hydroxy-tetrahydrodipicolinate reductase [Acidobacteriota bacterium]|jgi:4-hydroxy-tetrahydrodipicolinate reductase